MDFQSQVEARRAELKASAREAQAVAAQKDQERRAAEQERREEALDTIAANLSQHCATIVRHGDDLAMEATQVPTLDVEGLRRSKVDRLLKREARKMWTPGENWQVITLIVAGVFLITFYGVGLLLILGGVLRGSALNGRYREAVRQSYPALFPSDQAAS